MSDQWVVLELNSKAEGEDPDVVRKAIINTLKGGEVFIPAQTSVVGADRVVKYLVEGYAFVRHTLPETVYRKLENTRFVSSVLTKSTKVTGRTQRTLALVRNADIEKMKRQMYAQTDQGIGLGDTILVTSGPYKQITAKVIEEIPEEDKVQIHIQLRSKDTIVTLPRSFLKLVERAPRLPFMDKFDALKLWFGDYVDVLHLPPWSADISPLQITHKAYSNLCVLSSKPKNAPHLDIKELSTMYAKWASLEELQLQLDSLRDSILALDTKIPLPKPKAKKAKAK